MRNSGRMDFDFFSSPSLFVKEIEMTGFLLGLKPRHTTALNFRECWLTDVEKYA